MVSSSLRRWTGWALLMPYWPPRLGVENGHWHLPTDRFARWPI